MGEAENDILLARSRGLAVWLKQNAPLVFIEQKHLEERSTERAYWHLGYLVAINDVLNRRNSILFSTAEEG